MAIPMFADISKVARNFGRLGRRVRRAIVRDGGHGSVPSFLTPHTSDGSLCIRSLVSLEATHIWPSELW